jgi:hypothetical protein
MYAAISKPPALLHTAHTADVLDLVFMERHIAAAKAAWRVHAAQKTWEEKIRSIEKMWLRDKALKVSRASLPR